MVHQAIAKSKKEFLEKNPQTLVEIFDGGESPVEDFLRSLSQGGGLFVQKKMVLMRDVFEYNQAGQDKILDFLKKQFNFSEDTLVLITWRGKQRANKLLNFLKKKGEIEEFKKVNALEAEKFIKDKIEGAVQIEPMAVRKLSLILGGSLWLLDREVEKLINYKSEGIITESDVDEMSEGEVSVKIFDLVDAIGNQNKKRAHELLVSLLEKGEDGFYILSMMVFQLRNLALVEDCKNSGVFDSKEIARKTGLHPYVAQKTLAQLRNFEGGRLREMYERAFRLDINSKSGKINIKEALEDFIISI